MRSPRLLGLIFVLVLVLVLACADSPAAPDSTPEVGLGPGATLAGRRPFPDDSPWNVDVSAAPVDPRSGVLIESCGVRNLHPDFGTTWNVAPNGIPYVVVDGDQTGVDVTFDYDDESVPGPYPIPPDPPIEGGSGSDGDPHVLIVDCDNWRLYELFAAYPAPGGGRWHAGSGAIFDLNSNDTALGALKSVPFSAFEVVRIEGLVTP